MSKYLWQRIVLLQAEKEGKECARVCRELTDTLSKAEQRCSALESEVSHTAKKNYKQAM
jgi:hypothetical protein